MRLTRWRNTRRRASAAIFPAETTGKWAAAKFEHDSARPVDGYAAPQLHTHVVFFNLTETANGETRALQPQELYRTQQYATAVYRSELAARLKELGYEIERGQSRPAGDQRLQQEYLEASSPRRQQIEEHLAEQGVRGAGCGANRRAPDARSESSNCHTKRCGSSIKAMAAQFGHQPERVIEAAKEKAQHIERDAPQEEAQSAVTFSRDRNLEREAVADERELMRDALKRSMGEATLRRREGRVREARRVAVSSSK